MSYIFGTCRSTSQCAYSQRRDIVLLLYRINTLTRIVFRFIILRFFALIVFITKFNSFIRYLVRRFSKGAFSFHQDQSFPYTISTSFFSAIAFLLVNPTPSTNVLLVRRSCSLFHQAQSPCLIFSLSCYCYIQSSSVPWLLTMATPFNRRLPFHRAQSLTHDG